MTSMNKKNNAAKANKKTSKGICGMVTRCGRTLTCAYERIANGVCGGYLAIERGVCGGYKRIERGVCDGFTLICDLFIETFFSHDGESVAETRARLASCAEKLGKR